MSTEDRLTEKTSNGSSTDLGQPICSEEKVQQASLGEEIKPGEES